MIVLFHRLALCFIFRLLLFGDNFRWSNLVELWAAAKYFLEDTEKFLWIAVVYTQKVDRFFVIICALNVFAWGNITDIHVVEQIEL